jgi:hypothetical protein
LTNIKCCYQHSNSLWIVRRTTAEEMVTHHDLGENSHNREEEYDERRVVETPQDLVETTRRLMVELESCKEDNERMIKE